MRENTFVICAAFLLVGGSLLMQQWNTVAVGPQKTSRTGSYGCPLFPGLILPGDFDVKTGGNHTGEIANDGASERLPGP